MKLIHTADLHLGQVIYQSYDRADEHACFFAQLKEWCLSEQPDALLVCGDVFDIQQPSAQTKRVFTDTFADLLRALPGMHLVVVAGNHDSASRLQADGAIWELSRATLVGTAPGVDAYKEPDGWQDRYIVGLPGVGYIVALPYMSCEHREVIQSILRRVEALNTGGLPVVMTAHQAVAGMDATGHPSEMGTLHTVPLEAMGQGYDYLALGHIHKPQTLLHQADSRLPDVSYPAGVARYAGSALHVSCDEQYPHTVSLVSIPHHGAHVRIRQLRIRELRHFFTLPLDGPAYASEEEALAGVAAFCDGHPSGYIRLRVRFDVALSSHFHQKVYDLLKAKGDEVRYNPKILWEGAPGERPDEERTPAFAVADLQQMASPLEFIEQTLDQYPGLDLPLLREAFAEVEAYIRQEPVKNE